MESKSIIVVVILLLLIGGPFIYAVMTIRNSGAVSGRAVTESNSDMMNTMHPQQTTIDDGLNKDIKKISFRDAIGKEAPDFTLKKQDGTTFKLSDYKGKNVILFFNEGAMCYPACWQQIAALGKDQHLNTQDIVPVSIVIDPKEKWADVINSEPAFQKATMLFDSNKLVANAYDVLNLESSMHKGSNPGHTYYIIDKQGIITFNLDDPNMAINNDVLFSELNKAGV